MSNEKKISITLEQKDKNTILRREMAYTPVSYDELKNYIYKTFNIKYLYENTIFEIYAILCDKKDMKILIDQDNINNINNDLNNLNEFYIKVEKKNKNINETDVKQNNNNIEHNQTNLKQILYEFKNEILTDLTKQIYNIMNNKNNENNDRKKNNNDNESIQLILEYLNSNCNAILEIKNDIKSLNDKMLKIENDINNINLNFKNEVKNLKNNETSLNEKISEKNNISNNKNKKEILNPGISVDFTNEISDISLNDLFYNKAFMNIKIKNNGEKIWPNDLYLINYELNNESKSLYFKPILINDGISVAPMQEFNINIKIEKNTANYFNLTDYTFPIAIIDKNKKLLVEEIGNKKISIIENLSKQYDIEDLKKSRNELNNIKENENIGKNIKTNINEKKLISLNTDYNLHNKFENNNQQTKPENEKINSNFSNKKSNFEKKKIDNIKNEINNESKKDINNLCNELKNELGNLFTLDQIKESLIKNKLDKEKAKNYLYSISIAI